MVPEEDLLKKVFESLTCVQKLIGRLLNIPHGTKSKNREN